jgi:hypothetical protein
LSVYLDRAPAVCCFAIAEGRLHLIVERRVQFYFSSYDVPTVFSSEFTFLESKKIFAAVYKSQSITAGVGEFVVFQIQCLMLLLAFSENETLRVVIKESELYIIV